MSFLMLFFFSFPSLLLFLADRVELSVHSVGFESTQNVPNCSFTLVWAKRRCYFLQLPSEPSWGLVVKQNAEFVASQRTARSLQPLLGNAIERFGWGGGGRLAQRWQPGSLQTAAGPCISLGVLASFAVTPALADISDQGRSSDGYQLQAEKGSVCSRLNKDL